jgi:PTS hybrid protein
MELSQQYRQLDDPYLQARYIDIEDILQRTLRHLQGVQETLPTPGEPTIIADNIYPSTVLQLDASFVKGLCLRDSEQAHGAIIARARDRLAVPAGRGAERCSPASHRARYAPPAP